MRAVGLKVLKNRLSEYVRMAASGETVLVMDRDLVVAELGPPHPSRAEDLADINLVEAMRAGWLRAPTLPTGAVPPRLPVTTMAKVMSELAADREER